MKKIIFAVMAVICAFSVFTSCSEEPAEVSENEQTVSTKEEGNSVEEAVADYYSLRTEAGFAGYLEAFPQEFVKGYQGVLEYDDATFREAIGNATYAIHAARDEQYNGCEFHIEYDFEGKKELTQTEIETLVNDLVAYCYMTAGTIEKVEVYSYNVFTCGIDPHTGTAVYPEESLEDLTMLYITGEGWYVSPTNFQLP